MKRLGFDIALFSYYPSRIRTLTVLSLFLSPLFAFLSPAATIYVPAQYSTIQAAINAAIDTDEIIVSPSTYVENINFAGKNIILRSTNPTNPSVVATTIIDGNSSGSVVRFSGSEGATCVLSGFTITNGNYWDGGGIYGNGTLAIIQNNIITNNSATIAYGGGIYYCNGIIRNNTISNNSADLGGGLFWCDGTIENNIIYSNSATYNGGAFNYCNGTIQNNIIYNNTADGLGGGLRLCDGIIQNNIIYGNWAGGTGGGMDGCSVTIQNNTIYGNFAGAYGGGIANCLGSIGNCILWGNTAISGFTQLYFSAMPSYSCIQDWTAGGTGNISDYPQFVDPASGDFHLQSTSPCIDAGGNVPGLTQDFEGDLRPFDGTSAARGDGSDFDIGADEYIPGETAMNWQTWLLYK